MDELVQELRRASELFSDDGWWKPDVLAKAADEIEGLRTELIKALNLIVEARNQPDDLQGEIDDKIAAFMKRMADSADEGRK